MTRRTLLTAAGVTGLGVLATEATSAQAQEKSGQESKAVQESDRAMLSSSGQVYVKEKAKKGTLGDLKPLPGARGEITAEDVSGTGFTFRADWGNFHGQRFLPFDLSAINGRSRVFVAISEGLPGGPDAGKFIASARYTVHNVAPRAGGVDIWVNIEWPSDIRVYVDYLVINP